MINDESSVNMIHSRILEKYHVHNQKSVKLNQIQILVLDEADHMLDMGFIHDSAITVRDYRVVENSTRHCRFAGTIARIGSGQLISDTPRDSFASLGDALTAGAAVRAYWAYKITL